MSLLGFGMGAMLTNLHMCGIMLLRVVLNMLVRNASPRGNMEVLCRIDRVWSSEECVFCARDPNVQLDAFPYV